MSISQLIEQPEPYRLSWGTAPNDILTSILKPLISESAESYIPLICSHVCRHWRRAVIDTPSLWCVVDVTRGLKLTELWILRSADRLLDVRLSEWGFHCEIPGSERLDLGLPEQEPHDSSPYAMPTTQSAVICAQKHVKRWRSLDLGFYCVCRTYDAMSFLWQLPETLQLGSLTIGPMGRTAFLFDDGMGNYDVALTLFRKMNVIPTILRVDSYPISAESGVFSTHLTVLEVFAGPLPESRPKDLPDTPAWRAVLLASPNLVSIKLWQPSGLRDLIQASEPLGLQGRVELLSLVQLELSGAFVGLSNLFCESSLPKLRSLRIDSIPSARNAPRAITTIAAAAPCLKDLTVSSGPIDASEWENVVYHLDSLRKVTFIEMKWNTVSEVLRALTPLCQTGDLRCIQLQKVWDLEPYLWSRLNAGDGIAPDVSFVDCIDAQPREWVLNEETNQYVVADTGSNFSESGSTLEFDSDYGSSRSSETNSSSDASSSEVSHGVVTNDLL
ncbi:hypothetical protein BDV93DRAFT_521327 [Ceratobasidium sp. AG-I]|nr:hypothetical protein BDV93DRAFT_521327 [Ceratobasidium sp. AG-I]